MNFIKLANNKIDEYLNKKAFTLIELLAIIVILAIIAVITVPIILNIIENAKMGSTIDSAYGYRDAIQKYYITKSLENTQQELPSGYKSISELPDDFIVSGEKPSDGWVKLDYGNVEEFSLRIGDYVVSKTSDGEVLAIKNGEMKDNVVGGVKYYDAAWVKSHAIRYSPGRVAVGNTEAIAPGKCTSGNNCKTWYPYSEFTQNGETYVNMIMDRNTTSSIEWASSDDYMGNGTNRVSSSQNSTQNTVGISYPEGKTSFSAYGNYNNEKGPLTVLKRLSADTFFWNLPRRTDTYSPASNAYSNYTIDYSGYKARLISAEEIALIARMNTATNLNRWGISNSLFYFGSLNYRLTDDQMEVQRNYSWLFDNTAECTSHGCTISDSSVFGYWTSSPATGYSIYAWYVKNGGGLDRIYVNNTYRAGVRPVITVLKSDVF